MGCQRCGQPATERWNSDEFGLFCLCGECDVDLNQMILKYMCVPDREQKINRYRRKALNR